MRHDSLRQPSRRSYLGQLDRIGKADYVVSNDDLLRCRLETVRLCRRTCLIPQVGVEAHDIKIERFRLRLVDVCGAGGSRPVWTAHFSGAAVVCFVLDVSAWEVRPTRLAFTDSQTLAASLTQFSACVITILVDLTRAASARIGCSPATSS